ncbi:MAG: SIMPL domain-containing protein [Alphaproteobacteria bacterium]|nr:SIMPL domain-containing protein [Alphaproteobacteria bacterium]
MNRLLILPFAALLAGCLPGQEPKQIIVDGRATIEVMPDLFTVTGNIRSRSSSRADVLKDISEKLNVIREKTPSLQGLTHLSIEATEAEFRPILDPDCREKRRYDGAEVCPVTGYFGTVGLTLRGSPADLSGYVLSLISELGAEQVTLSTYTLVDRENAEQEAMENAVANARRKAEKIAASSGSSVLGVIRIQYGEGFSDSERYLYGRPMVSSPAEELSPLDSYAPETALDLDPQPIRITEKITAAFEIE